jgi:hypothetical protein
MTEQEITNWLIFGVAVAWFCKIGFHFAYLKTVDKSIKELNFVSFYLNISNFFKSFLLISPFFFSKAVTEGQEIKRTKWKVKMSTYALWTMFALTGFYLYHHPPKKEKSTIEYVLTKEKVR